MSGEPSLFFTLFKKFQLLAHVAPEKNTHGGGFSTAGFNIDSSTGLFTPIAGTAPVNLMSSNANDSPLWLMMNAKATGVPDGTPLPNTPGWKPMPMGSPPAWAEFQTNATPAANKLVQVFADWIAAGPKDDTPGGVLGTVPAPIAATDAGVIKLFVCSMPNDDGDRTAHPLPSNWWATSLIFLVDPATGATASPPTLQSTAEFLLVAVVGNRGATWGGQWVTSGSTAARSGSKAPALAEAWVAVWNSGFSPGVLLPSLSNLHYRPDVTDPDSLNTEYEIYALEPGHYELVGFRLNVQTVFDGLAKTLVDSGIDLGGLSAADWLKDPVHGAHLCVQVRIKGDTTVQDYVQFSQSLNTLTLDDQRRIAQKNLIPFDPGLVVVDPNPAIFFFPFITGSMMIMSELEWDQELGLNWIRIEHDLPAEAFRFLIAIPEGSFRRWFHDERALQELRVVYAPRGEAEEPHDRDLLVRLRKHIRREEFQLDFEAKGDVELVREMGDKRQRYHAPFRQFVLLEATGPEATLRFPHTGDQYIAMSLGVEVDRTKLKEGRLGDINVVQEGNVPVWKPKERCYDLERRILGGFTIQVRATDERKFDPRWQWLDDEWKFRPIRDLEDEGYGT